MTGGPLYVALAGGVGGAKLASGLARVLPPDGLAVVVNTGDDFVHLGLEVSPDIDTVTYTLAGIVDRDTGWGRAGETWRFMETVAELGGESWFRLGDRDLAVHVERTRRRAAGETLSAITAGFAAAFGVAVPIVPMSDDPVRTTIVSAGRRIAFQDYFVRLRCAPVAEAIDYAGAGSARPSPGFAALMADPRLAGVILCPSNPYLSLAPILALPGVRKWLARRRVPAVAVSPIVAGAALKGPAAKLMAELGEPPSAAAVARLYRGLVDVLVVDHADAGEAAEIAATGIRPLPAPAVMRDDAGRRALARICLEALRSAA